MNSEEYTKECNRLADEALATLQQLAKLMRENGDDVRAMDIEEAQVYVNGAMDSG